jgi:hypothetical protein
MVAITGSNTDTRIRSTLPRPSTLPAVCVLTGITGAVPSRLSPFNAGRPYHTVKLRPYARNCKQHEGFRCPCTPVQTRSKALEASITHHRITGITLCPNNKKPAKLPSKSSPRFLSLLPLVSSFRCRLLPARRNRHPHPRRRGQTSLADDKSLPPHVSGYIQADHRSRRRRPRSPLFVFLSSIFTLSPRWTA